jgi:Flp pilus assembly protein TadG
MGARGQALIEFAFVLPVFLLLLFGVIDGARLVYADATLSQAAREGSRVGSVEANWVMATPQPTGCVTSEALITAATPGAHVCPVDVAHLKSDVVSAINRMAPGVTITAANVYISCNAGTSTDPAPTGNWTEVAGQASPTYGNGCEDTSNSAIAHVGWIVSVRVVYGWSPVTPVISGIWPSFTRVASATMVIN